MKDGKCSKCGADDVYCGKDIQLKAGPFGSNSIPVSLTSIASLDNYVCIQCGYVERYVAEPSKLKEIYTRWNKVD